MSDRARVDQLVYGRYNDAVVWPLLVVGIAGFATLSHCSWGELPKWVRITIVAVPVAILETGMIVVISLRRNTLQRLNMIDMIPGLAPVLGDVKRLPVVWITIGALVLFALLTVIVLRSRDRTRMVVPSTLVALTLLGAGIAAHRAFGVAMHLGAESRAVRDIDGRELPAGVEVVYGFVPDLFDPGVTSYEQRYYSDLYQWYLPDHRFRLTAAGDYGSDKYVFAPIHDRVLENMGACVLWRDPAVAMALWFSSPDCPT